MLVIDVSDGSRVALELERGADAAVTRAPALVRHWGQLLETTVKLNAATGFHAPGEPHIPGTGPGPNVATGDYLRSIHGETGFDGTAVTHTVSTANVQGPSLEWGRIEVDSLGRHQRIPPYPHFGPALDEIEPLFMEAFEALVGALGAS